MSEANEVTAVAEQVAPVTPVEQAAPVTPVEQAAPVTPVEQAAPVTPVEQVEEAAPVVEAVQPVSAAEARELVYSYSAFTNSRPDAAKTNQRRTHLVALLESGQDVQSALASFAAEDEDLAS